MQLVSVEISESAMKELHRVNFCFQLKRWHKDLQEQVYHTLSVSKCGRKAWNCGKYFIYIDIFGLQAHSEHSETDQHKKHAHQGCGAVHCP